MSHAASIRALVLAVALTGWSAAPAHAGTIVFDFEDGLQGWELSGAVQRVQTQLLGGEWAIFGDGLVGSGAMIEFVGISLADVTHITLDAFVIHRTDGRFNEPPSLIVFPPAAAVVSWDGAHFEAARFVAFIDNITFHTIPEPSVLGMLALGGAAYRVRRRQGHGAPADETVQGQFFSGRLNTPSCRLT